MNKILISFLLSAIEITAFGQINKGLVAKYSFNNGNARDEIGSNDGIVVGAKLTKDRFKYPNKSFYFNGTSQSYINLGIDNALKPSSGSISLWFNIDTISNNGCGTLYNPIILAKNTNAPDHFMEGYGLWVSMKNRKILAITTESNTHNQKYFFSDSLKFDTWYHLVMTYDNDSLRLYVNNYLVNSIFKGFKSTFSPTDSVMIANTASTVNSRYFKGAIDDIRIYNRVLTTIEVYKIFNEKQKLFQVRNTQD